MNVNYDIKSLPKSIESPECLGHFPIIHKNKNKNLHNVWQIHHPSTHKFLKNPLKIQGYVKAMSKTKFKFRMRGRRKRNMCQQMWFMRTIWLIGERDESANRWNLKITFYFKWFFKTWKLMSFFVHRKRC